MIHDTHWVEMIDKSPETANLWCFHFMLKHSAPYEAHEPAMMEIYQWCQTTFGISGYRWIFSRDLFYFRNDSDTTLFKLTWY